MKCPFKKILEIKKNKKESIFYEKHDFGICDKTECPYYKTEKNGNEICRNAENELKRFGK